MRDIATNNAELIQVSASLASIAKHDGMSLPFRFRLVTATRAVQAALAPAGEIEQAARAERCDGTTGEIPEQNWVAFAHEMAELGRQPVSIMLPEPWTEADFETGCPDVTATELLGLGPMLALDTATTTENIHEGTTDG